MGLFGTMFELEERGIDPTELLRLMKSGDEVEVEENDELASSDSKEEEDISDGM